MLRASDRDAPADTGDFLDFIHHHGGDLSLEFELGWQQERPLQSEDIRGQGVSYLSREMTFSAEVFSPDSPPSECPPPASEARCVRVRLSGACGRPRQRGIASHLRC